MHHHPSHPITSRRGIVSAFGAGDDPPTPARINSGIDYMRRRHFITLLGGAAAAWPLAARAQQGGRMRRIGVLAGLAEDDVEMQTRLTGLRQGLERLGWSEGRNVRIDYRFAPASGADQAQKLAKE